MSTIMRKTSNYFYRENKIIKTEQNIALFISGFFWSKEKGSTVLRYVSKSYSVSLSLHPALFRRTCLLQARRTWFSYILYQSSVVFFVFLVFFLRKRHMMMLNGFYLKFFLSIWDLLDNLIWSWALLYKFKYCLCNP